MGKVLELAELIWQGDEDTYAYHPLVPPYGTETIADDTWFNKGFANTVVRKTAEGLVVIDPGGFFDNQKKFDSIRKYVYDRAHTIIFTHGHTDHVFGVPLYVKEAAMKGWPRPRVIAHEAVADRFRRYAATLGWNGIINGRQFMGDGDRKRWPEQFSMPDITYSGRLNIRVGDVEVHLRHARGETDDHTWIYFPDTRVLCTGDLFIYAIPNAGNPQKVQRYAAQWAEALHEMAALKPRILAPGHGLPVLGEDRVQQALLDTAVFLESIEDQVISLMNRGATLDEMIHTVRIPEELNRRPYLKPVYDEPEFLIRNIYRLYGGWYDGIPSHLKPAPEQVQAREIAGFAGGAQKLAQKAEELMAAGDVRLACHLADWAHLSDPENGSIRERVGRIYATRAELETSTMAKGIYMATARKMGVEPKNQLPVGHKITPVNARARGGKRPILKDEN